MAYLYPINDDAREAFPVVKRILTKQDVPVDQAVHALYVTAGFGLSFYPGQPGVFTGDRYEPKAGQRTYGHADAEADLDRLIHESEQEGTFGAINIPWELFLPVLMQLLQKWLTKK